MTIYDCHLTYALPGFYWTSQFAAMTEPVVEGVVTAAAAALGLLPQLDEESTSEEELKAWMRANMLLVVSEGAMLRSLDFSC